jgi:methionine--tRNA ligase beta chain
MEDPAKEVSIDDFKRLEVRVGTVVEVSRVPRTEKLYKVMVDLGEHGKKQTITGLVGHYSVEELLHKRIVFLCNLKEAKFAGHLSQGMLLAASIGDELSILTPDREIENGSRVS